MAGQTHAHLWLECSQQGDVQALFKLLASFHPRLRARAAARLDRAARARLSPEDVLQEVYLEVFRQIGKFKNRGPQAFFNWVLTILDNKLIDACRAQHRQVRDVDRELPPGGIDRTASCLNLLDKLYADSRTPSRVVRRAEALDAVLGCVSDLSDVHRRVIELRFFEGRPVADAADRLEKSPAAIVALTRAALDALRRSMDRLGDFTRVD